MDWADIRQVSETVVPRDLEPNCACDAWFKSRAETLRKPKESYQFEAHLGFIVTLSKKQGKKAQKKKNTKKKEQKDIVWGTGNQVTHLVEVFSLTPPRRAIRRLSILTTD